MNESIINYIAIFALGAISGAVLTWILKSRDAADNIYTEELKVKNQSLEDENKILLTDKTRLETELNSERKRIEEVKEEMISNFKAISSEVSQQNQKSFLELAEEKFKHLQEGAKKDQEIHGTEMKNLVSPVKDNLESLQKVINEIEKNREGSFSKIIENISHMREDSDKLRNITTTLAQTLSSNKARGRWGEIHLQRAFETLGMTEGVDFVQQNVTENNQRPDFTVYLPDDRSIIIDSKVPLSAFMRANADGIKDADRKRELKAYAADVKTHIRDLGSKSYWNSFDTSPEFVLMYLPNDSHYAAALEQDPMLFEEGINKNVFIMTPSTLMPTLFVIKHAWKQEKLAQNAKEISTLGQELYKRLCTFGGHFERIRKGLEGAVTSYDKAVGSLERNVMPAARRFKELQAIKDDNLAEQKAVTASPPRRLSVPEIDLDDKGIVNE